MSDNSDLRIVESANDPYLQHALSRQVVGPAARARCLVHHTAEAISRSMVRICLDAATRAAEWLL